MTEQLTQTEIAQQHTEKCEADLMQARRKMADAQAEVRALESTLDRLRALAKDIKAAEPKQRSFRVAPRKLSKSEEDSRWHARAMEILESQTRKKDLLARLHSEGFGKQVSNNALGVWLKRQADNGVLTRVKQGIYIAAGREGQ